MGRLRGGRNAFDITEAPRVNHAGDEIQSLTPQDYRKAFSIYFNDLGGTGWR